MGVFVVPGEGLQMQWTRERATPGPELHITSPGCCDLDLNTCQTEGQVECQNYIFMRYVYVYVYVYVNVNVYVCVHIHIYIYIYIHVYIYMHIHIYIYTYIYTYVYIYKSKWYVRNYVRIVCQGGDHSKKAPFF